MDAVKPFPVGAGELAGHGVIAERACVRREMPECCAEGFGLGAVIEARLR